MKHPDLEELICKLAYRFRDIDILQEALCHSSYVNEQDDAAMRDNERLEFLGDAVLNLAVGDILMERYPDSDEGALSRMRSNIVNEVQLAEIARQLDIGSYLRLGKGEIQSNGRQKKSILADALEAVIAAVHLDGGYSAARGIVSAQFSALLDRETTPPAHRDYKSKLQEAAQTEEQMKVAYRILNESGPDHDKTFNVRLQVGQIIADGTGKSKKTAEQDAARKALEILSRDGVI